ncbi:hypothetical protein O2K51_03265 [Apibacter raozihei]|uniref:hypothetical protein n=1 Tax=Apibacter raozihei TaxID=2500547 RepID=UPI000FE362E1|nr:hypothetical protein [Apibacter raozihei]
MQSKELRKQIAEACDQFPAQYAQLVKPINEILLKIDGGISEETADMIINNIRLYYLGDKYIADCHLEESNNFLEDALQNLKNNDLSNGALSLFGAGLNFASFASKASGSKEFDAHKMLEERFKKIKDTLK